MAGLASQGTPLLLNGSKMWIVTWSSVIFFRLNRQIPHIACVAQDEIKCHSENTKGYYEELKKLPRRQFGAEQSVQSLQKALFDRQQKEDKTLMNFSCALMRKHDRF